MADSRRSRNWCFTMNNPGLDEVEALFTLQYQCRWMIVGNEKGTNGTHHFQGFVMFKNAVRLATVKDISARAHWEIARGSWEDNKKYCSKDGDFMTYGTEPATQKRKGEEGAEAERERWHRMRTLAKEQKWTEMEDEFPRELTVYEGLFQRLAMKHNPPDDLPSGSVIGTWIYGPPGTGKTYWAMNSIVNRKEVYRKDLTKWWDGYDPERHNVVVVEDMDPFHKNLARYFKIWTQEYAFTAEMKGGHMGIRPKRLIVTSNYRIHEIWEDRMTQLALLRRFKCLKKLNYHEDPTEDEYPGQNKF